MKKTHEAVTGKGSAFSRYRQVMVGKRSIGAFLYYEFCQLMTFIPGALGMAIRKIFWPKMFGRCGKGTVFGYGVVIRQPGKMHFGKSVVISEYCVLDARNEDKEQAIVVGESTILSTNVMLSCKEGSITIGDHVGINAQTIIQSTYNNEVFIGNDCVIGQRCFVIGGGNYELPELDGLIRTQPIAPDGGITIGDNVWLGGNVTVLGGVEIGSGSIAGAGSVVSRSVPALSVCLGVPARVVKSRS